MSSPPVNTAQDDQNERRSSHIDPLIQSLHETMGRLFHATAEGSGITDFLWQPSFPSALWRSSDEAPSESTRDSTSSSTEPASEANSRNHFSAFADIFTSLNDDVRRRQAEVLRDARPQAQDTANPDSSEASARPAADQYERSDRPDTPNEQASSESNHSTSDGRSSTASEHNFHTRLLRHGPILYYISLVHPSGPQQTSETALQKLKAIPISETPADVRHCSICYEPYTDPPASELLSKSQVFSDNHAGDWARETPMDTAMDSDMNDVVENATEPAGPTESGVQPPNGFADLPQPSSTNEESASKTDEEMHFPLQMPCGHIFGASCLRSWLKQSVSCPLCRTDIEPHNHHHHARVSRFPVWFNPDPVATTGSSQTHPDNGSAGSGDSNTDASDDTASQIMINLFPPLLSMARAFGLEDASRAEPGAESGPVGDNLNTNDIPANGTDTRRWSSWSRSNHSYESLRRQQSQIMNRAARLARINSSSDQPRLPDTSHSTSPTPPLSLPVASGPASLEETSSESGAPPYDGTLRPTSTSPPPLVTALPPIRVPSTSSHPNPHLTHNLPELAQAEPNHGFTFDTSIDENLFIAFRNHFNDSELRFDANSGIPRPPDSPLHSAGSGMSDSAQSDTMSSQAPSAQDTPAGSRSETPERSGPSRRGGQRQHPYRR